MTTPTYTGKLVVQDCRNCGITFGVPYTFDRDRRNDHASFTCPRGHWQSYTGPTEEQRLREQLARKNRQLVQYEGALTRERQMRDQAEAEAKHQAAVARGHKGAHQRTKNRVAKGVCPCCKRSFVNVARHMAGQHPDHSEPTP